MTIKNCSDLFTEKTLKQLFPESISDSFFEALFGDVSEGAYDIGLIFDRQNGDTLEFQFRLTSRPGKCLRCSLTYGLPEVFSRHPMINVEGLVQKIQSLLNGFGKIDHWQLGKTREVDGDLHYIPLTLFLKTE